MGSKYDEYGQRREVDTAGCAVPFASAFRLRLQKIEGIDEPFACVAQPWRSAIANHQLELFEQQNPGVDDLIKTFMEAFSYGTSS